jgi:biopolymer transport protein ExbD
MQQTAKPHEASVMFEMNTTPLIDVMLVLLIMFIVTIPIQTHAVKVDLPTPGPVRDAHPVKNKVVVTSSGSILWNGSPISQQSLRDTLLATQQMNPIPELHLQPEPAARYELVDEVLAITKQARVEKMGFVGNERYARF